MSYIGQTLPADTFQGFTTDSFTGDGSATTFTLSKEPFSEDTLIVVINNVIQKPTTNFTVSGTTLTIVGTAVASGDVIYAIHTGGPLPVGGAAELDLNGASDKLILDADGDTTISADTDDQIDIKIAGADDFQFTANTFTAQSGSTITTPTLGVGNTKDLGAGIHIKTADSSASVSTAADDLVIEQGSSGNGAGLSILSATDDTCNIFFGDSGDNDIGFIQYNHADNSLKFATNATSSTTINSSGNLWRQGAGAISMGVGSTDAGGAFLLLDGDSNGDFSGSDYSYIAHDSAGRLEIFQDSPSGTNQIRFHTAAVERARFNSTGTFMIATTDEYAYDNTSDTAITFNNIGLGSFARSQGAPVVGNRMTDDGMVISVFGQGTQEGGLTVSGGTVSISGFTGVHWSRLADNSKPTILRGTIIESIDEMCDWYAVEFEAETTEKDSEGNSVTKKYSKRQAYGLKDGESVGDTITYRYLDGNDYSAKIIKEGDVKHTKCKISDTADSKKIYGVFHRWDDTDDGSDGDVNDLEVAQVGTYIIRVNKDVTVEAGDLLVSNGDGTAKKQDDDIIRSKTVAKVNSNIKVETYSDGSYTVPCTLHC